MLIILFPILAVVISIAGMAAGLALFIDGVRRLVVPEQEQKGKRFRATNPGASLRKARGRRIGPSAV